jgi:hypothetical protein
MSQKKYNKLRGVKKAIVASASGGIMAGMLLMGAGDVYAKPSYSREFQSGVDSKGMHMLRNWNSLSKINSLANSLGLDKSKIKGDLKSGMGLKQILLSNGMVPDEIKPLAKKHSKKSHRSNIGWV